MVPDDSNNVLDINAFKIQGLLEHSNAELIRIDKRLGKYEDLEESADYEGLKADKERAETNLKLREERLETYDENYESLEKEIKKLKNSIKKYESKDLDQKKEALKTEISAKRSSSSSDIESKYSQITAIDKVRAENAKKLRDLERRLKLKELEMKQLKAKRRRVEKKIRKFKSSISSLKHKINSMERKNIPSERLQSKKAFFESRVENLPLLASLLNRNVQDDLTIAMSLYEKGLITEEKLEERLSKIRASMLFNQKGEEKENYITNLESIIEKLPRKEENKYSDEKIKELKELYKEINEEKIKKNKTVPVPIVRFKWVKELGSKIKENFKKNWKKYAIGALAAAIATFGVAAPVQNEEQVAIEKNVDEGEIEALVEEEEEINPDNVETPRNPGQSTGGSDNGTPGNGSGNNGGSEVDVPENNDNGNTGGGGDDGSGENQEPEIPESTYNFSSINLNADANPFTPDGQTVNVDANGQNVVIDGSGTGYTTMGENGNINVRMDGIATISQSENGTSTTDAGINEDRIQDALEYVDEVTSVLPKIGDEITIEEAQQQVIDGTRSQEDIDSYNVAADEAFKKIQDALNGTNEYGVQIEVNTPGGRFGEGTIEIDPNEHGMGR